MKFHLPLLCSAIVSLCVSLHAEDGGLLKVITDGAEIKGGKVVIATLPMGKGVVQIKENGNWVGVRFFQDGLIYKGWIRKADVQPHDGVFPNSETAEVPVVVARAVPADTVPDAPGDVPEVAIAKAEIPAPVDEPPAPADEPPAPVDEPAAPADEPPAPADEPPAPADAPPPVLPGGEPPPPPDGGGARPVKIGAGTTTINFGPPPGNTPPASAVKVQIDPAELNKPPVVIRLKSVNEVIKKAQGLVMQVQPMVAGMISIDALLTKAGPMKDVIKQAIDFDKPIGFVVFEKPGGGPPPQPGQPPVDVCGIIPVKDQQQAAQLIQQMGGGMIKADFAGGYALVSNVSGLAEKAQAVLGMVQDTSDMQGDLEFTINAASYAKAMKNFTPPPPAPQDLEGLPPEMQEEMKKSQENYKKGTEAATAAVKVMGEEFTVMTSGFRITPDALELYSTNNARAGSQTASLLASLRKQPAPELSSRLPHQNAMVIGSVRISGQMLGNWMSKLLDKGLAENKAPTETARQGVELMKQLAKISAGNMAFAIVPGQGKAPSLAAVMGTQGSAADLVGQIKALVLAEAQGKGNDIQESERDHNGASVTTFQEERKKEVAEVATTDDMVLFTAGETVDAIQTLTNQVVDTAAGETPQQLASVAEKFGGSQIGMFSASVLKIAAAVMGGQGGELPPQLQAMAALDDPIVGGVTVNGQAIGGKLIIPAKAMQLIQVVVMQAMMGGGGPGGPPRAEGGPPGGGFGPPPGGPPPGPPPPQDAPPPDDF